MLQKHDKSFIFKIVITITIFDIFDAKHDKKQGIIYILHWTREDIRRYESWKPKRKSFTNINCQFQNCYLTNNSKYFKDLTDFDVILIDTLYMTIPDMDFPHIRSDNQLYLFTSQESSTNYPVPDTFNWFFNYTWTYKLNSDIPYQYIVTRNKSSGEIIAPKENVKWLDVKNMEPVSDDVKDILRGKKKAVAWFASNCVVSNGHRYNYALRLKDGLEDENLDLDIYGNCGSLYCSKDDVDNCFNKIELDYYFYLAFENSYSEDYVTEKLLNALNHFAVPVVMGGADYSRIMPDGIYLNSNVGEEKLIEQIRDIISNKEEYYNFFKWHRYYSYHYSWESADSDPFCALCAFLNSDWRNRRQVYANFTDWWNANKPVTNDTIVHFEFDPQKPYVWTLPESKAMKTEKTSLVSGISKYVQDFLSNFL